MEWDQLTLRGNLRGEQDGQYLGKHTRDGDAYRNCMRQSKHCIQSLATYKTACATGFVHHGRDHHSTPVQKKCGRRVDCGRSEPWKICASGTPQAMSNERTDTTMLSAVTIVQSSACITRHLQVLHRLLSPAAIADKFSMISCSGVTGKKKSSSQPSACPSMGDGGAPFNASTVCPLPGCASLPPALPVTSTCRSCRSWIVGRPPARIPTASYTSSNRRSSTKRQKRRYNHSAAGSSPFVVEFGMAVIVAAATESSAVADAGVGSNGTTLHVKQNQ